jgi:hypothetical protein
METFETYRPYLFAIAYRMLVVNKVTGEQILR